MATVHLRAGRDRPVRGGHPWVLSGAVASVAGDPATGDVVEVAAADGSAIGRGFFAGKARIRVRMLTADPEVVIDDGFFARRVERAVETRRRFGLPREDTTVYRLIHSEGDRLPGLVVDRYGEYLVVQVTVRGMERRREEVAGALAALPGIRGALLRTVGRRSGEEEVEASDGPLFGEALPERILVRENGVRFRVDGAGGQKTGHFADHRENRALVMRLARGGRVLDAFTGTGGFALAAAVGGAEDVTGIDSSPSSLAAAEENVRANRLDAKRVRFVREDVFRALRRLEGEGAAFDLVVLDPPRMAASRREVKGALRGYKELNLRALRLVRDGGVLATASCTGMISEAEFTRTVRDAAFDAGRDFTIHHRTGQGPDHPWPLAAGEGRYLKMLTGVVRKH
ncbi:MAG: class I SAM-dependent rRNA methyltransferase [Planctomycetota bacterium]